MRGDCFRAFTTASVNARKESFNIDIKWNYIVIMSLFPDKEATRVKNARHRNKSSTGRKCAKTSFRNYRLWIYSRGAFSRAKQFFRYDSQRAQTRTSDSILMSLRVRALLTSSCARETSWRILPRILRSSRESSHFAHRTLMLFS